MTNLSIEGGRALLGEEFHETSLRVAGRDISAVGSDHGHGSVGIDASGLKVLPGIVDLHGDAFERQMMPRAGVDFPVDVALVDSDRQAIANGITTVFHATTWSWEPGLRSADNARALLEEKLGEMTGKKARLTFATDESLLGGIVTRIGSRIYDGSVSNQLSRLREELAG